MNRIVHLPLAALLLCALGFSTTQAHAQGLGTGQLQFGIQASPTFSSFGTDNNFIEGDGTNLGLKLGVIAEYYFADNYSFHTGLNINFNSGGGLFYSDRFTLVDIWGESLNDFLTTPPDESDLVGGEYTYKYNLSYLEIPAGLTLRTRQFGYVNYYVRPLVALGILTGSNGTIERFPGVDSDEDFDISNEVNSLSLSWGIGVGAEYSVSTDTRLIGGLAFQGGFTDVTDKNGTRVIREGRMEGEDDSKATIRQVVITLGVMF